MRAINGLLALFFSLFYIVPSSIHLLWQPDETRYAEISREMLSKGEWIVPSFMGVRYFEKPIAGYWINNIGQWLFGSTNFAVRAGSVFSIALSAALVFWLASRILGNRKSAYLATFIYLSCILVCTVGGYAVLDPMLTLWTTASMASFYLAGKATNHRERLIAYTLLGIACAMGFMTKGFLALTIPVISVLPYVISQRRIKELLIFGPIAIVVAGLVSLPWVLAIHYREPDFWHYFFWIEHVQRFAEKDAQHSAPFWYYIPIVLLGSLPWLGLLPGALARGWKERKNQPVLFYLLGWVVMPLLFFSIAKGKLPTYILSCFAPLAILMTSQAMTYINSGQAQRLKFNALINIAFGVIGIVGMMAISPGLLPKMQVFQPNEWSKVIVGIACFGFWALVGLITWFSPLKRWSWAAAAPLLLALLGNYAIPQRVIDSKLPQVFINNNLTALKNSRYILTDSVGIGSSLAWELKRDDIFIFDRQGEIAYGLGYADAAGRYVPTNELTQWLAQKRQDGDVALVVRLSKDKKVADILPPADITLKNERNALLIYKKDKQ